MAAKAKKTTEAQLIKSYMEFVLMQEHEPQSVYKFCKEHNYTEQDFYSFFGSFDTLRQSIWNKFHENTMKLIEKSKEYNSYTTQDKLLTYYFTFFEMLTANRSYVLFVLPNNIRHMQDNMKQLKGLRKHVKIFGASLIDQDNEKKSSKYLMYNDRIFSEVVWIQTAFLMRFWMKDNSPNFEKTDAAIEKSVHTAFEVFDNAPLERVVDLGKFLWKESKVS